MNEKFLLKYCSKCGALVEVLQDCNCSDCGISCCGEEMREVTINNQEASFEKHMPVCEVKDGIITVRVNHVMEQEHYIEMIRVETENEIYIKKLHPEEAAEFSVKIDGPATVYSYCNKHGLWKAEIE